MARNPTERVRDKQAEAKRVRRKYKTNLDKNRKILPGEESGLVNMVVVLKIAGYNNSQIASTVGISRGQVKERLETPEGQELLVLLRQTLPEAALDLLQGYTVEAVQALVDVLRQSTDDKIIIQAASEILDRAGLPKASRQERHNLNEERTTFTDDGFVSKLRQASPEVQEQAAAMIESLESLLETAATEVDE